MREELDSDSAVPARFEGFGDQRLRFAARVRDRLDLVVLQPRVEAAVEAEDELAVGGEVGADEAALAGPGDGPLRPRRRVDDDGVARVLPLELGQQALA